MIPEPLLERLHLGELSPADAERLRARLTPADEALLAAMAEDDACTLAAHPPAQFVAAVARRAAPAPRRAWAPALAFAAVAAACVAIWLPSGPTAPPAVAALDAGVRAKGDPRLLIYRQVAGAQATPLLDGERAAEGDALQLSVLLDEPAQVAVISVDGRGAVTTHCPPAALEPGRHVFDHAFVLDDAPAFERFVLITAPEPIDARVLQAAADALARGAAPHDAPLGLPEGWRQWSTVLHKEGAR